MTESSQAQGRMAASFAPLIEAEREQVRKLLGSPPLVTAETVAKLRELAQADYTKGPFIIVDSIDHAALSKES